MARPILKDGVLEHIRAQVVRGDIPPGSALGEEKLSDEFHVSRTPVREAIRQLVHEGFAEYSPHCGARVVVPTSDLVREVLIVREALEGVAAREASVRVEEERVQRLREHFDRLRTAVVAGDVVDVGDEIHELLFDACHNGQLNALIGLYRGKVEWFQRLASQLPGRRARAFYEHDGILRALEARDPVWAENAARAHIRATLSELMESFREVNGNGKAGRPPSRRREPAE